MKEGMGHLTGQKERKSRESNICKKKDFSRVYSLYETPAKTNFSFGVFIVI
jgi:hypothetical protein